MGFCNDITPACDVCFEVLYGKCNDVLTLSLGLTPSTTFFLNLTDKFDIVTPLTVTTDGSGDFTITQIWTEFFGDVEVEIFSDAGRTLLVTVVQNGALYNCVILVRELSGQNLIIPDFSPDDITSIAVWLKGDRGITKDSNNAVSQWDFENGTFRGVSSVIQGIGANQPTHNSSNASYNNNSTVDFDGINDRIASSNFSSDIAQPSTYFVAGNINGTNDNIFDGTTATERNAVFRGTVNFGAFAGTVLNGTAVDSNPHIFEVVFDGVSSDFAVDGVSASGDANTQDLRGLMVGANPTPSNFLDGSVAEIIIYNALLTPGERSLVRTYLNTRFTIF